MQCEQNSSKFRSGQNSGQYFAHKSNKLHLFLNFLRSIPDGDVLLHTGDFTYKKSKGLNQMEQVIQFNDWLGTLPHKHKIVIAGNHDFSFDSKLA